MRHPRVRRGVPWPVGPTWLPDGVRLVVYSRHATALSLVLLGEDGRVAAEVPLSPQRHRTGDLWHLELEGAVPGQLYAFRAEGPEDSRAGHRFDPRRLLLDPHARALTRVRGRLLSVLVRSRFDWGEDRPLGRPWPETVLYELHVRGFTRHPTSGVTHPGTYRGLAERLPYLRDLGVTALELLPVHAFDEEGLQRRDPLTGVRLREYWGYNPLGFFAPMGWYAAAGTRGEQVDEFKELVRAAHAHGLEVILDVVFNHTGEGGAGRPPRVFRGLDNRTYYLLDEEGGYRDFTGCGNTLRVAHPVVTDFILECLRYFVAEFHVDGFRFDLAAVLARDARGKLDERAPLLGRLAADPLLRGAKLIAEPWDAAGAFLLGRFGSSRWREWNPVFRDDTRRFWRGDGAPAALAARLLGSPDLFGAKGPLASVNYVASHDGFTLRDTVSYSRKHNERNGEDNRDGLDGEICWHGGVEGPAADPAVEARRRREVRNLLATLCLAQGVPMLAAGDECYRTQQGNNNAYCQDNEISWFDWSLVRSEAELVRFTRGLLAWRRRLPVLRQARFPGTEGAGAVQWFGPEGVPVPAAPAAGDFLGLLLEGPPAGGAAVLLLFHRGAAARPWPLPPPPAGTRWRCVVDTAGSPPGDVAPPDAPPLAPDPYPLRPGSVVALAALTAPG